MITVDLSNVWGQISLPNLLALEKEVFAAHNTLTDGTGAGSDYLGWLNLPIREPTDEIRRIQAAAEKIRSESDICVIVGIGGSYLGARAAIELLQGPNRNIGKGKGDPMILFAGNSLSTRHWNELTGLLEGKDFSVIVISKSGTTTEPAIAFRGLKWMLDRKYGTDAANRRVYAITDPLKGALRQMAEEYGWTAFSIPRNVGGRYSVLTAVGLLPIAVAGIDIDQLMSGAAQAMSELSVPSLDNPAWQYAAARHALYESGKRIEILACYEPSFRFFAEWFKQLYGESEGKDGKGLFPASVEFTADLHSMGQYIQDGHRNLFETVVRFETPHGKLLIPTDPDNVDGLNFLAGKSLAFVAEQALRGTILAHVDGGVPNILMSLPEINERCVGWMIYFFELVCGLSGYLLEVNPFDQPGVEDYKKNMFALLGKPGYEDRKAQLEARL